MIVPAEIQQWYNDNYERLQLIEKIVRNTLDHFVYSRGYLYSGRIKGVDSLAEKIDTGRIRSLDDIDDGYAGTVVIPTYAHEDEVSTFLRAAFAEDKPRARFRGSSNKQPDLFRFDSTRLYFRITGESTGSEASKLLFELQIVSAFDYAWQSVTHDLVYKHPSVDWRRLRVAAQMKALVEQLDSIGENFDDFVESIRTSEWPEVSARRSIIEHVATLFGAGRLPEELEPVAASRFAETVVSYLRSDGCRNDELPDRSAAAMVALDRYLDFTAPKDIPRSLTLAQLVFGIMFSERVLSPNVRQRILCNESLVVVFPQLRNYRHTFGLDR